MELGTKREIERKAWQILSEAGLTKPPVDIDSVIGHLKLHLDYYSLEDPGFLERLGHKFQLKSNKILKAVKDSKLIAAWFPEGSKILLDKSLPLAKQTFPKFHEVMHSVLPWHKEFFRGDTAQTLHPEYQDDLEFEANYGASELWLCGPEFRKCIVDQKLEWKSVATLKKMFGATYTTTFWKFIISQETPVIGCVSTPNWKWDGKESRCRHLMSSSAFANRFNPISKDELLIMFENKIAMRRGGPLGSFSIAIADRNGDLHEFRGETFFNSHDLLTMFVHVRKMTALISAG